VKRVPLAVWIVVVVIVAGLAMPIKQTCGAPGRSCATAQDAQGNMHYDDEIEPLAVLLLESVLGSNIPVYYTSGEDVVKVAAPPPPRTPQRSSARAKAYAVQMSCAPTRR
jgi:hypothetical protein